MTKQILILYHFASCPFCIKVQRYLDANNISIETKDIMTDPNAKDELMSLGGKTQVPCLNINGRALYESDDIIHWFETHYDS